jgi:hypothetical chaperone protein
VARTARHPERLRGQIALIQDEQGFPLYQTVSAVKAALSQADSAVLRFAHAGIAIDVMKPARPVPDTLVRSAAPE